MPIKLLAMDLDGTVINNDHLTVSQKNLDAIRAAQEKGVLAVPTTGRAKGRLPDFLQTLNPRYAITSNGAKLLDLSTGETLYRKTMPAATADALFRALARFPVYIELYAGGCCYTDVSREPYFAALPLTPNRREMMVKNRICVPDLLEIVRESPIEKLNLPLLLPEQQAQVRAVLDAHKGLAVTSSLPQNAEVNAAGCNKGNALAFLCGRLGIQPEEVLALGDNGNDVEFLRFAGTAAVPANAADCAKAAGEVFPLSNEDGFAAAAIERYIL